MAGGGDEPNLHVYTWNECMGLRMSGLSACLRLRGIVKVHGWCTDDAPYRLIFTFISGDVTQAKTLSKGGGSKVKGNSINYTKFSRRSSIDNFFIPTAQHCILHFAFTLNTTRPTIHLTTHATPMPHPPIHSPSHTSSSESSMPRPQ